MTESGKPRTTITADALFSEGELPEGAVLEGEELTHAYWRVRGKERERSRQESFWASTNEALSSAYAELERKRAELDAAQGELMRLNSELEARVETQVHEIVARAHEVEVLNAQLRVQVRERSRELAAALDRLAGARNDPNALAPGAELGERVRIIRELGHGGMGAVFLAQDLAASEQLVAVKVLNPRGAPTPQLLQRFLSEARAAAAISHPAVIRSLAIDLTADGRIFQILEYVHGITLAERLVTGPGEVDEVTRVGALIADALAAAHALGVVHRDVKPSNILLSRESPSVKIFDFGIAKLRDEADPERVVPTLTGTGEIVGTPEYISPEQAMDAASVGPASDVYSFGVVLFEWLAGRRPFDGTSVTNYLFLHTAEPPPRLRSIAPVAPDRLGDLVDRCLAKAPASRPTATELARELSVLADTLGAPQANVLVGALLAAAGDPDALSTAPTALGDAK